MLKNRFTGSANITLRFLQSIDTCIDAQNMNFTAVKLNGTTVPFINTGKQIQFVYPFCKEK
jgi:hypothetical protein